MLLLEKLVVNVFVFLSFMVVTGFSILCLRTVYLSFLVMNITSFYLDLFFINCGRLLQIEQLRFLAISVVKNMCIQMTMLTDHNLLMIHSLL